MRLTLPQIAMTLFLGERLPIRPGQTVAQKVTEGHALLVQITGSNLGLDPQRWHDHLRATNARGYRWGNGMTQRIAKALADPAWQAAVAELQSREGAIVAEPGST